MTTTKKSTKVLITERVGEHLDKLIQDKKITDEVAKGILEIIKSGTKSSIIEIEIEGNKYRYDSIIGLFLPIELFPASKKTSISKLSMNIKTEVKRAKVTHAEKMTQLVVNGEFDKAKKLADKESTIEKVVQKFKDNVKAITYTTDNNESYVMLKDLVDLDVVKEK